MPINQADNQDTLGGGVVAGEGAAGTATGGVLSIQGAGVTGVQVPARDIINVSSQYQAVSVTSTAVEAKGATTRLVNRKFVSITPTNGTIYWATNSSVTTANGTPLFVNNTLFLSFSDNVTIFMISSGTVDVRVLEAS